MTRQPNKSKKGATKPKINPKLEGFEVVVDKFGEVKTSLDIDKINAFLDEEVEDKKLLNRKEKVKKRVDAGKN